MTPTVVFDLDGTLVDSAPDITAAVNRMLADEDVATLDQSTVVAFVGNGLPDLVRRVIAHCDLDPTRHAQLCDATLRYYNQAASALTRPYPGVVQALEALRSQGCVMGLCTNKPTEAAHHVLDALNLSRFFRVVVGGDSLSQRKPDPIPLRTTFKALNASGPQVFVGDSEVDAETAQRADIPFLLFTQGYRKTPVDQIPHLISYDDTHDLPALISQVVSTSGN